MSDEEKFKDDLETALECFISYAGQEEAKNPNSFQKICGYFSYSKTVIDVAGVVILFAYTVINVGLWCSQQTANRTSYDAFVAANRPWISISEIKLLGPITFLKNGDAYVGVSATATNFGHSPTIFHSYFKLEVVSKDLVFAQYFEEQAECNLPDNEQSFRWSNANFLIPNSKTEIGGSGSIAHTFFKDAWPKSDDVIFRVVGCVDYTFPSDPSFVGEQGYSGDITRLVDGGAHQAGFNPKIQTVPMNQITLTPTRNISDYTQ